MNFKIEFIVATGIFIILLYECQESMASNELNIFLKNFQDAEIDLKWIRDTNRLEKNLKQTTTHRHNSLSDVNKRCCKDDGLFYRREKRFNIQEKNSGDAWYNSFKRQEIKQTQKNRNDDNNNIQIKNDTKSSSCNDGKRNNDTIYDLYDENYDEDYSNVINTKNFKTQKTDSEENPVDWTKLKTLLPTVNLQKSNEIYPKTNENNLYYSSFTPLENSKSTVNSYHYDSLPDLISSDKLYRDTKKSPSDDQIIYKDQSEKTRNDLSHEANYKLSKIEQENIENVRNLFNSDKQQQQSKNPDYQINNKKNPDYDNNNNKKDFYTFHPNFDYNKRNINPNHEIKLKISNRMISRGMSASLPSDSLDEINRDNSPVYGPIVHGHDVLEQTEIDDRKFKVVPDYNLFKRENVNRINDLIETKLEDRNNNHGLVKDFEQHSNIGRKLLQVEGDEYYENFSPYKTSIHTSASKFNIDPIQAILEPNHLFNQHRIELIKVPSYTPSHDDKHFVETKRKILTDNDDHKNDKNDLKNEEIENHENNDKKHKDVDEEKKNSDDHHEKQTTEIDYYFDDDELEEMEKNTTQHLNEDNQAKKKKVDCEEKKHKAEKEEKAHHKEEGKGHQKEDKSHKNENHHKEEEATTHKDDDEENKHSDVHHDQQTTGIDYYFDDDEEEESEKNTTQHLSEDKPKKKKVDCEEKKHKAEKEETDHHKEEGKGHHKEEKSHKNENHHKEETAEEEATTNKNDDEEKKHSDEHHEQQTTGIDYYFDDDEEEEVEKNTTQHLSQDNSSSKKKKVECEEKEHKGEKKEKDHHKEDEKVHHKEDKTHKYGNHHKEETAVEEPTSHKPKSHHKEVKPETTMKPGKKDESEHHTIIKEQHQQHPHHVFKTPTKHNHTNQTEFNSKTDPNRINIKLEININNGTELNKTKGHLKDNKIIDKREIRSRNSLRHQHQHQHQRHHKRSKNLKKKQSNSDIVLDDLVTGKLPNQLVNAIFQLVKTNENLQKHIGPSIKNRIVPSQRYNSENLDPYENNNPDLVQRTEDMLRKITETVSSMIDEQVQSKTCIPLRPDLQEFFDKITDTSTNKHQNDPIEEFEELKFPQLRRTQRSTTNRNKIREKYKLIQNLLHEHGRLSADDQIQTRDIKSFLEKHLILLDELETMTNRMVIRKKRSTDDGDKYVRSWLVDDENENDEHKLTEKFIKLARTAQFIRKNVLFDVEHGGDGLDNGFDYLNDYQNFDDYSYE